MDQIIFPVTHKRSVPTDSLLLKFLSWFIFLYFTFVILYFIRTIFRLEDLKQFIVIFFFSIQGMLIFWVYTKLKQRLVDQKINRYVRIIRQITDSLIKTPPSLNEFDFLLYSETSFIWKGAVSTYLIATDRLLDLTRILIMAEESRTKIFTSSEHPNFLEELHSNLEALAKSIEKQGPLRTFNSISSMILLAIKARNINLKDEDKTSVGSYEDFISECTSISEYLKQRRFSPAEETIQAVIDKIHLSKDIEQANMKWEALIAFWISIRIAIIRTDLLARKQFKRPRVGPSRILAFQIDEVVASFKNDDMRNVVNTIIESFDWRKRIPLLLRAD